jgi:hypothetical protein
VPFPYELDFKAIHEHAQRIQTFRAFEQKQDSATNTRSYSYLLQVDGWKIAIDYNDSKISQGSGGEIFEQLLLRSKPIHQETKTTPTSEQGIDYSLQSTVSLAKPTQRLH